MASFPHNKEYSSDKKVSFLPAFFKFALLLMVWGEMLLAEKVAPDLFPLSIGNSWTFALRTGGTREYSIESIHKDSLAFIVKINSSGFSYIDTFALNFYDSLGQFNKPLARDLSNTLWGPHCAVAEKRPLTTPAGTFSETYTYPVSWGHPSGGNQSVIASPGIGCIAIAWTDLFMCDASDPCLRDTFAFLQSYQLVPTPQATEVDTVSNLPNGTNFSFSFLRGDSGLVTFKMPRSSCASYMVSSSFNPLSKTLRIYFVDTASIRCQSIDTVCYSLKLHNLKKDSSYTVAIYSAFFDSLIDIYQDTKYPLKTDKKYSESIICNSTAIIMNRNKISSENRKIARVYDISGRLVVKYRKGFPGDWRHPSGNSRGIYMVQNNRGTITPLIITKE